MQLKKNMTIKNIRDQIDSVDQEIAALLKKRWRLVAGISALKKLAPEEAGYRPFREQDIYNKLPHDDTVTRDEYWTIWKEIMTTTVMRENTFHIATTHDFFRPPWFWPGPRIWPPHRVAPGRRPVAIADQPRRRAGGGADNNGGGRDGLRR